MLCDGFSTELLGFIHPRQVVGGPARGPSGSTTASVWELGVLHIIAGPHRLFFCKISIVRH